MIFHAYTELSCEIIVQKTCAYMQALTEDLNLKMLSK